jgi:hypothetical protein
MSGKRGRKSPLFAVFTVVRREKVVNGRVYFVNTRMNRGRVGDLLFGGDATGYSRNGCESAWLG